MIGATLASALIGTLIGLLATWNFSPIQFTNANPADLKPNLKDDYVIMISAAYELDGNLALAKKRLSQLVLSDPARTFNDLITREKQSLGNPALQDALIHLSQAVGYKLPFVAQRPAPGTRAPIAPLPTDSIPVFELKERTKLFCADEPDAAFLRFFVRDRSGRDLPNIAIAIRWANTEETVYTGLQPERGTGYADVQVEPGKYAVSIQNARSDTIADLEIGAPPANCKTDHTTPRGWKLIFQQK